MVLGIYYKEIFHCDKNLYDKNRIFINFEDICFNPDHSMEQLSRFLGRNPDVNVFRIYRKIKIPRINILGGIGKAKYGWSGLHRDVGDQEYMISVIQELKSEMKSKVLDEFFRLCEVYESKFQSKICKQVSYA
jgi:hypothetical protein